MLEKTNDKIAAIFEATLTLVSEQGLHATPMSQIAAKAKLGMGTIYHYFSSKEELINGLYLENKARLIKALMINYRPEAAVYEAFKTLFTEMIIYYTQNPAELYFLEQCENSPIITQETKREGLRAAEIMIKLFERARTESLIKEIPFDILSAILMGSVISLTKLCLAGAVKTGSAEFDTSLNAIWDMVKR